MMQPSPQMQHSLSPRPGSSQGLLDMSNGYPNSTSPLPGSTSPSMFHKVNHSMKPQHSPNGAQATMPRGGGGGGPSMASASGLPPGLSYPASFGGQEFVNQDIQLSNLNSLHPWNTSVGIGVVPQGGHPSMHHNVPHVSVSSSSPPPHGGSPSPLRMIKSEPVSPPRDGHTPNGMQHMRPSSTGHLSPGNMAPGMVHPGHLTPNNPSHSHSSPEPSLSDYESGPMHKRPRMTDPWAT
ncbi:myocyte-specific enhancer factor 2-like [Pollicipes pollicipes]|uniref:myocyte-specific enhancer factor 2-like n=1 Tax=Pollicipes pollicipes TaxID=41117 RepID=UPI001884E28D|nr:myocyte-specific enhancer factor 2-like [Pollicipes pollicipes]